MPSHDGNRELRDALDKWTERVEEQLKKRPERKQNFVKNIIINSRLDSGDITI